MKKNQTIMAVLAAAALGALYPLALTGNEKQGKGLQGRILVDGTPPKREGGFARSYADVVDKVSPAVVSVYTATAVEDPYRNLPQRLRYHYGIPEYDPDRAPKQNGVGSGVIISRDGYILTNHHVAGEADEIKVYHSGHGRSYDARLVGSDKSTDMAVIKVDTDREFDSITIGDSSQVRSGDVVLAFGSPFGLDQTVSMGIVSAVGRKNVGLVDYGNFIQTDASINRGNSGGALVDVEGRLIGINNAIFSLSGGNNGIGFAIPSNLAVNIASQLQESGKVEHGYLGIVMQNLDEELASYFKRDNLKGVLVSRIESESPADKAGFQRDDLIVALDGRKVSNIEGLRVDIGTKRPGSKTVFTVLRGGKEVQVTATLGRLESGRTVSFRERREPREQAAPAGREEFVKGVHIENLSPRMRAAYRMSGDINGVIVTAVGRTAPESNRRLQPGDVITEIEREPVSSVAEALEMKKKSGDRGVLVRVRSLDGSMRLLVVK